MRVLIACRLETNMVIPITLLFKKEITLTQTILDNIGIYYHTKRPVIGLISPPLQTSKVPRKV